MPKTLLSLLSKSAGAKRDEDFVEALLQAWAHVVEADYHSLVRRFEVTGKVEFWHPGEGRLGAGHRLVKLFARLWAVENPMDSHPNIEAFSRQGPGVYLRSALEQESVWKRRAHYRLVDRPMGIEDMVSVFLTPSHGTLVMLNAGSRGPGFSGSILGLAEEFAGVANALLMARGGFSGEMPCLSARNLTGREREILQWVGEGKRNTEIAGILGLSAHTVRKHLENVFAKLGVETRTAAVAALRGEGGRAG
jgi:DNA-binding CsgD family transcriptional regulator